MLLSFIPSLRLPILAAAFVILASCGGGGGGGGTSPSVATPTPPIAEADPVNPAPQPEQPAQPQHPAPQPEQPTEQPGEDNTESPDDTLPESETEMPTTQPDQPAQPQNPAPQPPVNPQPQPSEPQPPVNPSPETEPAPQPEQPTTGQPEQDNNKLPENTSPGNLAPGAETFTNRNYRTAAEFNANWGIGKINADAAYQRGYFGQGVTVAVVDSGVRASHRDLSAHIAGARRFDFDGNTLTTGADEDINGHGTFVAGIVGGIRDGQRFHGVAPLAGIMPLRVLGDNGRSGINSGAPAAAFRYAMDNSVHIINNSWGYHSDDANGRAHLLSLVGIIGDNDVAVVWAAGNSGTNTPELQARAPLLHPQMRGRWLAVVATDQNNHIASFSDRCGDAKNWCLAAPGVSIFTAGNGNDEQTTADDGTSAAAPHVSGALALLRSRLDMPMSVLVHILLSTATDLGAQGIDNVYGHGLVNIPRAITVQVSAAVLLPGTDIPPSYTLPPPNDSDNRSYRNAEFGVNWGLGTINADAAYQRGYFGQGVTVAIVDSGVRASHVNLSGNILAGAARYIDASGNTLTTGALADPVSVINGRVIGSHGTGIAGIIAGLRGDIAGAADAFHGHGVAPSASILPVRFSDDVIKTINYLSGPLVDYHLNEDAASAALRYAAEQNVHIINNSWGAVHTYVGYYGGDESKLIAFEGPVMPQFLQYRPARADIRDDINNYADILRGKDTAVVWAGGNNNWNGINGSIRTYQVGRISNPNNAIAFNGHYTPQQLADNFVAVVYPYEARIPFRGGELTDAGRYNTTIDPFEPNGVGDYALAPLYRPELLGRWLAVVATDENNVIASFSNGCGGRAKHWCLAAPGVSINAANARDDNARGDNRRGTSFAAPHVSGALALLKSRLPDVPMSVLVVILLDTATDIGEPGVDDVYGHGLVNVSAAIAEQNNIRLPAPSSQGVLLKNANTELPSSFAGFAKRLNGVGVAAEYLDGFYYDAPLGGMIKARGEQKPPLDFAAGMFGIDETINDDGVFALSQNGALQAAGWRNNIFQLRHNFYNKPSLWQQDGGDITRRPFFAHNNNGGGYSDEMLVNIGDNFQLFAARGEEQQAAYSQTGIQWQRKLSSIPKLRLAAAHSNITEDNTLLGGKFGGLMPLTDGGNIRQTDIGGSYALDKRWRLFGNYQRADINAKLGGIVGDISGVVAAGWSGGFAAKDWLREGDNFRIGIGKATRITGGEAVLNINQSNNPQKDQSTQAMHNRGYETKQQRIGLSQQAPLYLNAGYIFAPGDNSQLAIALNYHRQSPSAISIEWRWDF